jgi:hypothetical protein
LQHIDWLALSVLGGTITVPLLTLGLLVLR